MKTLQTPLNQTQLHLLQMFSNMKSKKDLAELKKVLSEFYKNKIDFQMDELFSSGKMTMKELNKRASKHSRTPYSKK